MNLTQLAHDLFHLARDSDATGEADFRASLEKGLAEVMDTLEWLVDLQNGCPLPKYENDWNRTIAKARKILGREP
jgi:hypothetical protein